MIVPMKKYAFMVYHKEYDAFLHILRDLGVVHVKKTKSSSGSAELQELLSVRKRISVLQDFFQKLNSDKTEDSAPVEQAKPVEMTKQKGMFLVEKIENLQDRKTQLLAEKQALQKEIEYMQLWGDFSYTTIENLREAGYKVSFFTCPTSRFDTQWTEDYHAILINNMQSVSYFVTITKADEPIEIEAERPKMPDRGLNILLAASAQLEESISHIDKQLNEMSASDCHALEIFDKSLQDEFNFNDVVIQTERQADEKMMFLEGWTTAEQATHLETELDKQGYFYLQVEIQDTDKVPIQLKNNSYFRLFEPITKMFSLPNHTELDPTPLLAPFFMLFFGLCFGDAGYGLLILLICTILKFRVDSNSGMRPILSLAQWLGGTTLVVGLLITGTVFGVALVDVPALASIKDFFLSRDRLMQLALSLGMIHIVYGKAVAACKIKKQRGFKYSVSTWGWVIVLTSMLTIFAPTILAMFGEPLNIPPLPQIVTYICYGVAAIGALAILLYNSPGKSIVLNIGSAIWSTYNMASGMLGDTLSYIRLFAIGLTGGILGSVFNMLAIDQTAGLSVAVRIPVMLFVLLLGHGLNIGLCTIASLVHPVRLIFVEYFKNAEFEGGGVAYAPFKKV